MVVQTKICLYELLEVARDADDADIKKAYRKQALRWHPDKNADNVVEATSRFKQIQEAYDILKDPNERAWYDSHREQVLRGGSTEDAETEGVPDFDLAKWCTDKAFKDFSDQPKGFFTVYAQVFAELVTLEEKGSSEDAARSMPEFGTKTTPLDKVETFYGFWVHFASTRTFVHREKWRLSEAPSRQVKRIMERDNKKARDGARKEYNDLIRELARWVKQKDPRIVALKRKQAEDAEQARILSAKVKAEQEERKKELRQEHRAIEAARMEQQAKERREKYGIEEEEDEEPDEIELFDCELCHKSFKSQKQWENHQQGNKHKQAVANFERTHRFECRTCSVKFPSMNALKKHENTPEHVFAVDQAEMRKDRSETEEESTEEEEGDQEEGDEEEEEESSEASTEESTEEEESKEDSTESSEEETPTPAKKVQFVSDDETESEEEEEEEEDLAESLKKLQVTGKNKAGNGQADKGESGTKKLNKTQKRKLLRQQEADKRKAECTPAPKKASEPPVRIVTKGKAKKEESDSDSEATESANEKEKDGEEEDDNQSGEGEGDSEDQEETETETKKPEPQPVKKLTAKQARKLKQQLVHAITTHAHTCTIHTTHVALVR